MTGAGRGRGHLRTIADGALVGATNPKGLVFFAAVLPQSSGTTRGAPPSRCCCSA